MWLTGLVLAAAGALGSAQTLARPGWAGSGLDADPWWQHAVFYEVQAGAAERTDPATDAKALIGSLDGLRSLGVDALLLPAPRLPEQTKTGGAAAPETTGQSAPENAATNAPNSAAEDLDELVHEASLRGMRVLLSLPASGNGAEVSATARFWLGRGVAGFHIVPPAERNAGDAAMVQEARRLTAAAVGQRVVLTDLDPGAPLAASDSPGPHAAERSTVRPAPQLQIDLRLSAAPSGDATTLRPLLAEAMARPNVLLGLAPAPPPGNVLFRSPDLAKAIAAILLTTRPATLIGGAGQSLVLPPNAKPEEEPSAEPTPGHPVPAMRAAAPAMMARTASVPAVMLTEWYRQLIALHHGNAAVRNANATMLNFDGQNALAWVDRAAGNSPLTPPVVVACNLSASPVTLSLGAAMKALGLRGTYLRTLLRSDRAMGPQDLNAVILPPYAVYIGELRR